MDEREKRNRNVDLGIIIVLIIAIICFFIFVAGVYVAGGRNNNSTKIGIMKIFRKENEKTKQEKKKEDSVQNSNEKPKEEGQEDGGYKIGETWTVDGQWSLTVNSVQETPYRNEFSELNPAAVYIVTYTYINLGKTGGLFMTMDGKIVDSAGKMGHSYPGDIIKYAQDVPVGATCEAQSCIAVDNPGNFKIYMDEYDDDINAQSAVFNIEF